MVSDVEETVKVIETGPLVPLVDVIEVVGTVVVAK